VADRIRNLSARISVLEALAIVYLDFRNPQHGSAAWLITNGIAEADDDELRDFGSRARRKAFWGLLLALFLPGAWLGLHWYFNLPPFYHP
jgi:hypothetical protein